MEGSEVNDRIAGNLRRDAQPFGYLVKVKEITVEHPPTGDLKSERFQLAFHASNLMKNECQCLESSLNSKIPLSSQKID